MTIKNTRKNISAEDEFIVTNVTNTAATKANNKSNFSTNQKLKIKKEKFYDETNRYTTQPEIEIPLSELVRLGYLEDNYYNKNYIDAHIKIHIKILQSRPYPNDNNWAKKWAADVRIADQTNYIFLVAFPSNPNSETHQDGGYEEYYYYIDESHAEGDYSSEKMESAGSFIIDLSDYLREENFNDALEADTSFITLVGRMDTAEDDIDDLEENKLDNTIANKNAILVTDNNGQISGIGKLGNIDKNGKLYSNTSLAPSKIVITDSNGIITGTDSIATTKVVNTAALDSSNGLNLPANSTQALINSTINSKFKTLYNTDLNNYLLKSDIKAEIWGVSGFKTLQDQDHTTTKLGDYIYNYLNNNYYNKSYIDNTLATLQELQMDTLDIL